MTEQEWAQVVAVLPNGTKGIIENRVWGWGDAELEEFGLLYVENVPDAVVMLVAT